jgi:STE24 endopeptidase
VEWNLYSWIFLALFTAHLAVESGVDLLQLRHLARRPDRVPSHLEGKVDLETIRRAVRYNRDRLRLGIVERFYDGLLVWGLIAYGFGAIERLLSGTFVAEQGIWFSLVFLFAVAAVSLVWGLPPRLVSTFGVEARHGFNRRSLGLFAVDELKGLALGAVLGGILALLVLWLMSAAGDLWWLAAFAGVAAIQVFAAWIYPVVILPLFQRLEPVEDDLARDVERLAREVGFPLGGVVTMDGSRRSRHANAFIVGLGGPKRIVLFDTLVERLDRRGLLAVLAHELGHFELGHARRRLLLALGGMLAGFAALGWLREQPAMYAGLGLGDPSDHGALLAFVMISSEALFPFGFLLRRLSRADEHAADRFAVEAVRSGEDLAEALVALGRQNLSSPGSHRLYRAWRNTHPALRDRLREIRAQANEQSPEEHSGESNEK